MKSMDVSLPSRDIDIISSLNGRNYMIPQRPTASEITLNFLAEDIEMLQGKNVRAEFHFSVEDTLDQFIKKAKLRKK